jgi:hypothetical protein
MGADANIAASNARKCHSCRIGLNTCRTREQRHRARVGELSTHWLKARLQGGVMKCGMPDNCRPAGEICDPSFGECCRGNEQRIGLALCQEGTHGVFRCQGPCCTLQGDACKSDAECCSGSCNDSTDVCDNGFNCGAPGEACMDAGELTHAFLARSAARLLHRRRKPALIDDCARHVFLDAAVDG